MAAIQKNFAYQKYVDDQGNSWNVRGEVGGAFSGVDGHATDYTLPAWGKQTPKRHVRYAVAQDPTTFRTVKGIIYTAAAFAALSPGDAVNVSVPNLNVTVVYNISDLIAERKPIPHAPRPLADHA